MLGTSNSCPRPSAELDVARRSAAAKVEALCRLIVEKARTTGLFIGDNGLGRRVLLLVDGRVGALFSFEGYRIPRSPEFWSDMVGNRQFVAQDRWICGAKIGGRWPGSVDS